MMLKIPSNVVMTGNFRLFIVKEIVLLITLLDLLDMLIILCLGWKSLRHSCYLSSIISDVTPSS